MNAQAWKTHIVDHFNIQEWEQTEHTHENRIRRSPIDRIYLNQELTYQLEKHCDSAPLPFPLGISAHRRISFARRSPKDDRWLSASRPFLQEVLSIHSFWRPYPELLSHIQDLHFPNQFETLEVLEFSARLMHLSCAISPKPLMQFLPRRRFLLVLHFCVRQSEPTFRVSCRRLCATLTLVPF